MFVGGMCMYRHARIYPYIHTYLYIPLSPLTISVQELSSLALSSMNFPFRSKVVGIENFVPEAFPRLAASDEITMVSLRSFIFHGASKVGGSVDRSKTHRMRCVLWCCVLLCFGLCCFICRNVGQPVQMSALPVSRVYLWRLLLDRCVAPIYCVYSTVFGSIDLRALVGMSVFYVY